MASAPLKARAAMKVVTENFILTVGCSCWVGESWKGCNGSMSLNK